MRDLGQWFFLLRQEFDFTQAQIAAKAGVHQTAWSMYERGERLPDRFAMQRLCKRLGIPVDYQPKGYSK